MVGEYIGGEDTLNNTYAHYDYYDYVKTFLTDSYLFFFFKIVSLNIIHKPLISTN